MRIECDNFRKVEVEYAKYVSKSSGILMLNIIDFQNFKRVLTSEYTEQEIKKFF